MAKWGFSSKLQSSQDPSTENVKKISGSLAQRVLLVCLVLIVAPLCLHSLFLFHQEVHLKTRDLFSIIEITAKEKERSIQFLIQAQLNNLRILGEVFNWQDTVQEDKKILDKVADDEYMSSFFFQQLGPDQEFLCTYSAKSAILGQKNLFSDYMHQALKQGQAVFLAEDPFSHSKQLYISQVVNSEDANGVVGVLTMGMNAQNILESLTFFSKKSPYQFSFSLISNKKDFFITTDPTMTQQEVALLSSASSSPVDSINKKSVAEEEFHFLPFKSQTNQRLLGIEMPVVGADFFLLVDIPEKTILDIFHREIFSSFSTLLLLIIIIGGGGTVWLTLRMSRPSKVLNALMEKVSKGDFSGRYKRDRLGFEVNVLGEHFNKMIESLLKKMQEVKSERLAKEILANELNIGHEIQRSILPKEVPEFADLEIAAGFWPAKEVAGDFYDLFVKKEEKHLLLSIADAAGKGISACLYSLLVRSMLRSYAAVSGDLAEILTRTNNLFCLDTGDSGFFVTAWVGLYDAKKRLLHYLCCGHHPAILYKEDGTIIELGTPGIALGVVQYENISCFQIQLSPGDLLILYTDGIIEAHNPNKQMFGRNRLLEVIHKEGHSMPSVFVQKLVQEVSDFSQGTPLYDDLTLVAIKVL